MPDGWRLTSQGSEVSRAGLEQVANELLEYAQQRKIWLFYGEMGSGKTTLIKTIARQLGVKETTSSPTFSIVNEYTAAGHVPVFHIDLYRIKSERELADIGLEEYLDSGSYCFIEWPEKLGGLTPAGTMKVRLTHAHGDNRTIMYQSS